MEIITYLMESAPSLLGLLLLAWFLMEQNGKLLGEFLSRFDGVEERLTSLEAWVIEDRMRDD